MSKDAAWYLDRVTNRAYTRGDSKVVKPATPAQPRGWRARQPVYDQAG
jgi:hypothetical protein